MSLQKVAPKDSDDDESSEVTECLICGKLFPRGPIDLARHGAAVTLKHFFSEKKSSSFPFGCKKCTTYFSTKEHLEMHSLKSKCNPAVVRKRAEEAAKSKVDQQAAALKKLQKSDSDELDTIKSNDDDKKEEEDSPELEVLPLKKEVRSSREAAVATTKAARQSHPSSAAASASPKEETALETITKEPKEGSLRQKAKLANAASAAALLNLGESAITLIFIFHLLFKINPPSPRPALLTSIHSYSVPSFTPVMQTKLLSAWCAVNCSPEGAWISLGTLLLSRCSTKCRRRRLL